AAHRGRQAAGRRRHARCARPYRVDRAIGAFHPGHVLCADHALARRARRALPYRSPHQADLCGGHMNISSFVTTFLVRFPIGAAILYVGLVALFAVTAWTTTVDILERREAVAATAEILSQLEGRKPVTRDAGKDAVPGLAGSPLLEGATVTIGGANLL